MSETSRALIEVDLNRRRRRIDENLFGLHIEHIWTVIYPCVWVGEDSEIPNTGGIRDETVSLLSQLRPTVCKYPGGYFTDFYDWRDGIGPRDARRAREYPCVPGRVEPNTFGTAEFVTLCRRIGAVPYLSVNTVSLHPSEAGHWVEYCNGTRDTYWANQRRRHGYDEPFNVPYWAIGNENYWLHSPEAYGEKFRHWTHCMFNIDPTVTVVAGGIEPGLDLTGPCTCDGQWADRFLANTQACRWWRSGWHPGLDEGRVLYSFHPYFSSETPECSPEQYRQAFNDLRRRLPTAIATINGLLDEYRGDAPRPKLCFDEFGLIFPGHPMDGNMTQPTPFWPALWLGEFYHLCLDHADDISMATHPGAINMEHALVVLDGDRIVPTPSFHMFRMLRNHGGAEAAACEVTGVSCDAMENPLSCRASVSPDERRMTLSVLNLDLDRDTSARVAVNGARIQSVHAETLVCDDLYAQNTAADPTRVAPKQTTAAIADGTVEHTFPAHSAAVLTIELTP